MNIVRGSAAFAAVVVGGLVGLAPPSSAAKPPAAACGQTLTTSVKLTSDLVCVGPGLTVDASASITVDLNGHSITGSGTDTGIMLTGGAVVTVKDGSIAGFGTAMSVVTPATLQRLTFDGGSVSGTSSGSSLNIAAPVTATKLDGAGAVALFSLFSSDTGPRPDGSTFDHVSFGSLVDHGADDTTWTHSMLGDVTLQDSTGNVFQQGTLGNVFVHQSNANTFRSNRVDVLGVAESDDTVIDGNTLNTGGPTAIYVDGDLDRRTQVTGNLVDGYDVGLRIDSRGSGLDGSVVSGNKFRNNNVAGLWSTLSGDGSTLAITGNVIRGNGGTSTIVDAAGNPVNDGVHVLVTGTSTVTLTGNEANNNADLGIDAAGAVDGGGNTARHNGNPSQCAGVSCS